MDDWRKEVTSDGVLAIARIIPSNSESIWLILTIVGGVALVLLGFFAEFQGWAIIFDAAIVGYVILVLGALVLRAKTTASFGRRIREVSAGKREFVRVGEEGVRRGIEGVFEDFSSWDLVPEFRIEKDSVRLMYRGSWLVIDRKNLTEHEWLRLVETVRRHPRQQPGKTSHVSS